MSEKLLSLKTWSRRKLQVFKLIETRVKIRTIYKEVQKIKAKLNQLIEKKTVAYIPVKKEFLLSFMTTVAFPHSTVSSNSIIFFVKKLILFIRNVIKTLFSECISM
jgi:hypothetical protein